MLSEASVALRGGGGGGVVLLGCVRGVSSASLSVGINEEQPNNAVLSDAFNAASGMCSGMIN